MSESTQLAKTTTEIDDIEASRAPLQEHLNELRSRLIRIVLAVSICSILAFFVTQVMIDFLMEPFYQAKEKYGTENPIDGVFFESAFEILFIRLRMAIIVGVAAAFPLIAWEIYAFVAPGLYKSERQAVLPYLFATPFLFVAGAALVYYMILPFVMRFAFGQEFEGVTFLPKAKPYVDLAISLIAAFGVAFQTPIVLSLLARAGIVNAQMLRKGRKYAVFIIFVMAMFLTPPDPFSQTALAVPVYLLYELGIIAAAMVQKKREEEDENEAVGTGAP